MPFFAKVRKIMDKLIMPKALVRGDRVAVIAQKPCQTDTAHIPADH